jgi:DNA modification methylase
METECEEIPEAQSSRGGGMNCLYYGNNLNILREDIADKSIDLIYLDPPFNSQANYNVLFRSPAGEQSPAQIEAFEDTWHWTDEAEKAFDEVMTSGNTDAAEMLRAMRSFLKENDLMAYLTMMAVRLTELHRVLKPTGSLYLHCDPTASHYLKILLDAVFGPGQFLSEIAWKRTGAHNSAKRYGPVHDVLLYFSKTSQYTWNQQYGDQAEYIRERYTYTDGRGRVFYPVSLIAAGTRQGSSGRPWRGIDVAGQGNHWRYTTEKLEELDTQGNIYWPPKGGKPRLKMYETEAKGSLIQDWWDDIPPLNSQAQERLGYPTQKPEALLERIIQASSNEGDVVLDPFCGCGTTIHAAQKLRRQWIGIDITHLAISLIEKRLRDAFPGITYEVRGTPKDLDGARALAAANKHQFQLWAVSLVNALPFGGTKKGADTGIDGLIYFKPDGKTTERAIVSVKGGENVGVAMIRDLAHVVDREKAKIGLFVTLAESTGPMRTEAIKVGYYESPFSGKIPKIQILTIEELFAGRKPHIPLVDVTTFKKAQREDTTEQGSLWRKGS